MLNKLIPQYIKQIILKILLKFKWIYVKGKSQLSINLLKSYGSKEYPVLINSSNVSGVTLSEGCKLYKCNCMGNDIKLGRFVSVNGPGTTVSSLINGVEIGSFSSIAEGVKIHEWNHRHDKISTYFMNRNIFKGDVLQDVYSNGAIKLEEDVWIGTNSVILSGIKIGRGSIIGAGSVVTRDIPRYSIAFGNPAKVYKKRFDENTIEYLEKTEWWNWNIEKIKENKNLFCVDVEATFNDKAINNVV